jgi:hypothetical protein
LTRLPAVRHFELKSVPSRSNVPPIHVDKGAGPVAR